MKQLKSIELPGHIAPGGFDHAAFHAGTSRLYVAHTSNDSIDVIDCAGDRFLFSIPGLTGAAGALVSEDRGMVFTSNRGEDTVGIFNVGDENNLAKIKVGVRPNGLAFDPQRGLLLAANVGDPHLADSFTISIVDIARKKMVAAIPVPGRTRWTVFDARTDAFYVNIAEPARIIVIAGSRPADISRTLDIPADGPHGLDLDPSGGRLFCACDDGELYTLSIKSGEILDEADLSGAPDVIFFNQARKHLYVAVGEPGVIDLFETDPLKRIDTISTERGAHTIGFDASRNKILAFLPGSHRADVYLDE